MNRFVCAEILPIDDWVSFSIPVFEWWYSYSPSASLPYTAGYRFRYPCLRETSTKDVGYRFRYPWLQETSTKESWVSFSTPVMVMGFLKAVLGIIFDSHDGHRKFFGSFGSVWGNLRALGIVFDTRE